MGHTHTWDVDVLVCLVGVHAGAYVYASGVEQGRVYVYTGVLASAGI